MRGVERVLHVAHTGQFPPTPENLGHLIASLAGHYRWIMGVHDAFGADLIPRIAGVLQTSPITQVNAILGPDTFTRPVHAGQAIATVVVKKFPALLTIRPTAFTATEKSLHPAPIVESTFHEAVRSGQHRGYRSSPNRRPDLSQASIIVAGGQGLDSAGNFHVVEELADTLDGAVGATRGAVDAGLASSDLQIGQTGRVVAPDLYIGLGISGAIQHLAGIKDAGVIVAINHDPEAPLHAIADFSLVADLFEAAPRLNQAILRAKKNR